MTGRFRETVDFGDGNPVESDYWGDTYLCKNDSNSNLTWVQTWTGLGGTYADYGHSVAIDNEGNFYVTGYYLAGSYDAYLCKLNANGNFLWMRTWSGELGDRGYSVSVDNLGGVYVAGEFALTVDFGDGNPITSNGWRDAYLCKYDSNGNFRWVKTWGGYSNDECLSVSSDNEGNVYVTGYFGDEADFGDGILIESIGFADAYLCKYNSMGDLQWVETWGGSSYSLSYGNSVSLSSQGNIYVTGEFGNIIDFGDGNPIESNGSQDAYLCKYNSNGDFQWVKTWGGFRDDSGFSVSTGNQGYIYVTGEFEENVDFGDGNQIGSHGSGDAFVCKYNSNGDFWWVKTWGGIYDDAGYSVSSDNQGNIYVTGRFSNRVDFGDGNPIESNGWADAFLLKYIDL